MLDHVSITVSDLAAAERFYDAIMKALEVVKVGRSDRWLGYGEEIDAMLAAWESGDRQGAAAAAPWHLIEEMFVFGSPDEMKERIAAFVEGGVTLPILTPITTPDKLGELIEALAP